MSTSMYNTTLLGWNDGTFYPLHIIAIVCMLCSFIASVVVIMTSFKTHKNRFFSWSISDRFVIYLAVCEMGFNFVHMFDHVTMVITKDHVRPLELCQFYAFVIVLLVSTKNLILVTIALNAFLLMRFRHQMEFGSRDWRMFAGASGGFAPRGSHQGVALDPMGALRRPPDPIPLNPPPQPEFLDPPLHPANIYH
uniref:Uncharacterized protein LOC111132386 n=1 Tax=Crassostrea virginica TaxID=6565 RepID=A0A8B8E6W7_CRAVI|nr:uncharacterized protein LOC111132386 [Crassostrea virginica]